MPKTLQDRIRSWTDLDAATGCWVWRGHCVRGGYGQISVEGWPSLAHRVAYEAFVGAIPDGMMVCHKCDNPPCCNPDHLFLGTGADNMRDRDQKGRGAKGERVGQAKLTAQEVETIRARYAGGGVTQRSLAQEFRVDKTAIAMAVRGDTWKHVSGEVVAKGSRRSAGEDHGSAKLTNEAVTGIRREYASGTVSQRALAGRYGVSQGAISLIVTGKGWKTLG